MVLRSQHSPRVPLRSAIGGLVLATALGACGAPDESRGAPEGELGTATQAVASSCVTLRRGVEGAVSDTFIGTESPGSNYGTSVLANSGANAGFTSQALFRWDLGTLPPGASVVSASVTLYQTNTGLANPKVHLVTGLWNEGTVTWSSFGGAFNPGMIAQLSNASPTIIFDVSATVREWVKGTIENRGLLIEQPGAAITHYKTSDWAVIGQRPKMDLCYSLACAAGTADCDGNIKTGCEASLKTASNCGACGVACALPNAVTSCATGACVLAACNAGTFDCDGNPQNGCEALPCGNGAHCAAGAQCGSGVCAGGLCQAPSCADGVKNGGETGTDCGGSCGACGLGQGCAGAADCASGTCQNAICTPPILPVCDGATTAQVVNLVAQGDFAASQGDAATTNGRYGQASAIAACYQDALYVADHASARGYVAATDGAYARAMSLSGGQIVVYLEIAAHAAARGYVMSTNNAYAAATAVSLTVADAITVAAHSAARGYVAATDNAYAKAMSLSGGQLAAYLDIAAHAAARGYVMSTNNAYAAATGVSLTVADALTVAAHSAGNGYVAATDNAYTKAMDLAVGQIPSILDIAAHAAARGYVASTNNAYAAATFIGETVGELISVAQHAASRGYPAAANAAYAKATALSVCSVEATSVASSAASYGYPVASANASAAASGLPASPCGTGSACAAGAACKSGTCGGAVCSALGPACNAGAGYHVYQAVGIANTAASVGDAATANVKYAQATLLSSCYEDALGVADAASARGYAAATNNAYAKAMALSGGQLPVYLDVAAHAAGRGYAAATNDAYGAATDASLTVTDALSVAAHSAARGYGAATNAAYARAMALSGGQLAAYLDIAAHAAARGYGAATNDAYTAATGVAQTIPDVLSVAAHAAARGYGTATNDAYAKATSLCGCSGEALAVAAHAAARGYGAAANTATAKAATLPACP